MHFLLVLIAFEAKKAGNPDIRFIFRLAQFDATKHKQGFAKIKTENKLPKQTRKQSSNSILVSKLGNARFVLTSANLILP